MSAEVRAEAIAVYGRAATPGRAKTRLARDLGPERAAAVYAELLRTALRAARAVDAARYLYLPPGDALAPARWPLQGFTVAPQCDGDLGARMESTFAELFDAGHERVVLVGSDLPDLSPSHLEDALRRLRSVETVFGPATDGGYWLVGQRSPGRDLFAGIPWSTATVWDRTRARLDAHGWAYAALPELDDVDDVAALRRHAARGRVIDCKFSL